MSASTVRRHADTTVLSLVLLLGVWLFGWGRELIHAGDWRGVLVCVGAWLLFHFVIAVLRGEDAV